MQSTPKDPSPQDWERALAKFAVIAPLVCRDLAPDERNLLRTQILSATHVFPGDKHVQVSARALREWCQLHREHGLNGLLPRSRKDKGKPRAIPQDVLDRAMALRRELPSRSAERISDMVATSGTAPVSASTLAFHFRKAGLDRRQEADPKAFRRFEHPRPNACWQSDLTDGILLPDPTDPTRKRRCYLHGFLDDHSRLVPHAAFYWRESLPALEDCFRQAILKRGIPAMCYWDNGAVYRSQQLRRMAARLKVEIVFSTPYAPEGKGKIERLWGTIKSAFYPEAVNAGIQTLDELNRFFWGWLDENYHQKVHGGTGQTPLERWEAGREFVRFATPEDLADVFLWEEERVVRKTGTVALCGNHYATPAHLIGERVMVRFDPFDLQEVKIAHHGQVVCAASPQELVSRTYNKAVPHTRPEPRVLDSSKDLKEQLSAKGKDQAPVRTPPPDDIDRLTALDLQALVASGLAPSRDLTNQEKEAIGAFWQRHAPLRARTTVKALSDAVAVKGRDRHVDFYLEAVRHAHWGVRP